VATGGIDRPRAFLPAEDARRWRAAYNDRAMATHPPARKAGPKGAAIELFVSHVSSEAKIAAYLREMLDADFIGMVELFASSDVPSIQVGEKWLDAIRKGLDRAAAVLVLCSKASLHRPWVQFEIGAAWYKGATIVPVCHSGMKPADLPLPLAALQGIELGTEHGLRKLNTTIASILGMPRAPQPNDIAGRLARIAALERVQEPMQRFGRYMDIIAPAQLDSPALPARCTVESNSESLGVFGLAEGATRWSDIEAAAREAADQRWLKQLQECIWLASCGRVFQPVQAVYHGKRGSFQPHLAKREWQADGDVRYHVHLIETTVAPLAEVQNDFGLLATLLRLGLRFRFEVIQRSEKALAALPRKKPAPPAVLFEVVRACREALETIETDAMSRGAQNMDRVSVSELFDSDDDKETMASIQDEWDEERGRLYATEELALDEFADVLRKMRDMNYRFMHLATRRFHEMVVARWQARPKTVPEPRGDAPRGEVPCNEESRMDGVAVRLDASAPA
jgi:hypothetical protein